MNSHRHIESLSKYQGRRGKLLVGLFTFAPIFFLLAGLVNLISANHFAVLDGGEFIDLVTVWFESIDPKIEYTYSGVFLLGMERLNTALIQIAVALIFSIEAYGIWQQKKYNSEILRILKMHGEA